MEPQPTVEVGHVIAYNKSSSLSSGQKPTPSVQLDLGTVSKGHLTFPQARMMFVLEHIIMAMARAASIPVACNGPDVGAVPRAH